MYDVILFYLIKIKSYTITFMHMNSFCNLVTFTKQDYFVTDFQIVKELLMHLLHQFYKASWDNLNSKVDFSTK